METFLYLTFEGKVTIAIREEENSTEIGVAFCSPYDQFSRPYGRKLALERLNGKKDFYVCFKRNSSPLKCQVRELVKFIVAGKWIAKSDIENELDMIINEVITETSNNFPNDIAPMTIHTNTIPTWAKRAVLEKNFY